MQIEGIHGIVFAGRVIPTLFDGGKRISEGRDSPTTELARNRDGNRGFFNTHSMPSADLFL